MTRVKASEVTRLRNALRTLVVRSEAQDKLCKAYRLAARPSDEVLDTLIATSEALKEARIALALTEPRSGQG